MSSSLLSGLIRRQAEKYADRTALRRRDYRTGTWVSVSWNRFADIVDEVADALLDMGVGVQENIGIFSQNMPECLYVDFGAFRVRAVTVPFYATSSEAQIHYMVADAEVRCLFVGEQQQYDVAFRVMSLGAQVKQIIIFDRDVRLDPRDITSVYFDDFLRRGREHPRRREVDARAEASSPEDIANILYTSGTTGDSKGVMLHHACYEAAFPAHNRRFPLLGDRDVVVNFLPFTHVFERAWSYWCLTMGCTLAVNLRPQDILTTLREIRPTAMCSVPRFWEKVYAAVEEKIAEASGVKKALMTDALRVGKAHNVDCLYRGLTPSPLLHLKYKFYEKTVFSLLKRTVGIENGRFFPTAGATIPPVIQEFVLSAGINMIAGYGLTESTATVSSDTFTDHLVGSVGRVMPHVELKIDEETHEILLRGKGITRGYYCKEAATRAAFTDDGWFRTGDAGYLRDGHLFLTERIKDLFKTSNGKYIAPQAIESRLSVDRYIDQISVIADERKFVSALIVPEYRLVEEYAARLGIRCASREELVRRPEIVDLFRERIDTLQQQFAHYEQIKRFTLLPRPFSMERGELTNTLKVRRAVLVRNYAAEIEKMYED